MKKKILWFVLTAVCLAALLGAFFAVNATETPATDIVGHNLALDDSIQIDIIYYVDQTAPEGAETGVLCWFAPQESYTLENAEYKLKQNGTRIIGGKEYAQYNSPRIHAKMITQDVYAVSYVKVGNEVTYSDLDKYSVLQYCYNKKGSTFVRPGGTATLGELITDMLNYGATVQKYFNFNTDRLANAEYHMNTVVDGTLKDGTAQGLYYVGETIVLSTDRVIPEGYRLVWRNSAGVSLGVGRTIEVAAPSRNETYTPVLQDAKLAKAAYTRIDADGNEDENGDYILFGSYPQREITDGTLKLMLMMQVGTVPTPEDPKGWTSYGYYIEGTVQDYMWYVDVSYNGETYRGVYFTSYRSDWTTKASNKDNTLQDDYGYTPNNFYWFLYEPLKWRILSEEDGTALILCESIIDSQQYYNNTDNRTIDGETIYPSNYEHSDIRAWLNKVFYETAFDKLQQELIETTLVDNSARSTNPNNSATAFNGGINLYTCKDTEDNVFLLSEKEATTSAYGFGTYDSYGPTNTRCKKTTAYAKVQGVWIPSADYADNGQWWLRSPDYAYSTNGRCISHGGWANPDNRCNPNSTRFGIVPAMQIWLGTLPE
ncbi:MAG: hypothetical protein E7680_01285 [Ruminococcaceae bacterium]|nr:hypothetical protein [Oscillospiraceae bacterium]